MSLSNQTDRKRLIINSEINRNGQSRDNFSIFLNDPIPHYRNKIKFAVRKVVMPNTVYSIHPRENRLYYIVDPEGNDEELKHITLPTNKVYQNADQLADDLSDLFEDNGETMDVEFLEDSQKLKFTNTSAQDIRLVSGDDWETSYNGTELVDRSNVKIGLTQDLRGKVLVNGGFTTAQNIPKIQSSLVFHLISQKLVDNATSITPNRDNKPHILATLINNKSWGDNLWDTRADDELWQITMNSDLDQLDLQVVDDQYRQVSLNGAPLWVEIETEYV